MAPADTLEELSQRITSCRRCERLVRWREASRLVIVGLAPAAEMTDAVLARARELAGHT